MQTKARSLILSIILLTLLVLFGEPTLLARTVFAQMKADSTAIRDTNRPTTIALSSSLSVQDRTRLHTALNKLQSSTNKDGSLSLDLIEQFGQADVRIQFGAPHAAAYPLQERFYVAVVPFDTVQDDISWAELALRWKGSGQGQGLPPLFAAEEAVSTLSTFFGQRTAAVVPQESLLTRLQSTIGSVGILDFDQLDPRYKVLTIDGMNPLSNQFKGNAYPLKVSLTVEGRDAEDRDAALIAKALRPSFQPSNREADHLTTLIMTGVTAMSRGTAAQMAYQGVLYPAELISGTLSAADITHISNEVPFLDDCVVNNSINNLTLCSHTSYLETLRAVGTDIVGLSGNHVNDFGYDGAQKSLQFYRENGISIYGSGLNVDEACAPLRIEHNDNKIAFLAVLAFGPSFAWATDELPGACHYYDHKERILESIEQLAEEVDIVAVEIQYLESYNPYPTSEQITEFRELRAAGADLVTGVQSHVPQAMEPYGSDNEDGPGMIAYGLGNLFFDQMWSWATRTELMARHTFYEGRLLNTEILTAILENYAQPRWATEAERTEILERIFGAAPVRQG